jgi:hypothetical protein
METQPEGEAAPKSHGLNCPYCGILRPYNDNNDQKRLGRRFEHRQTGWFIVWLCPKCSAVLGELGGMT